jgi:glycosyltransferase involved in cell wall biosynthesis
MKLSIIIPVYQVQQFIYTCLASLHCANRTDTEIIVVDDGSTDQSYAEILRYTEQFTPKQFTYIKQANAGLSEARNTGLQAAKGEYVFFIDGDDWLTSDAMETIHANLHTAEIDMWIFDVWKSYTDFQIPMKGSHMQPHQTYSAADALVYTFTGKMMVSAWSKIFKRSVLMQPVFAFPKGMWYEDLQLIKLYLDHPNLKIQYLPKALYHYRQREGSITQTFSDKIFNKYIAFENIAQWLVQYDRANAYNTIFQNFYLRAMVLEMVNSLSTAKLSEEYRKSTINKIIALPISVEMRQGYFINNTLTFMQRLSLFVIFSTPKVYTFLFSLRYKIRPYINQFK